MYIFLGASGESVYECEIPLFNAFSGDVEIFFRLVWDVVRGVLGRIVVLVCIYAEYREISGVTWPHPIVCVASELAYG